MIPVVFSRSLASFFVDRDMYRYVIARKEVYFFNIYILKLHQFLYFII